jgi:phosphoribosylamine---glycine ligase
VTRVLIVGGGGREHALAWASLRGRDDVELIVAPGNGGTARIAENVALSATDASAVAQLARERDVDLVIIGPDAAAAAGVTDSCLAEGLAVFGPTAEAARIEASKSFAKALMDESGIPSARWMSGAGDDRAALERFIADEGGACVVKADGLALGKGVVVCSSETEAHAALDACLSGGRFGDAGRRVVVEQRLQGIEVSVLGLSDGRNVRVLPPARDHKRAFDGDRGPNTGGMGALAPAPDIDGSFAEQVASTVLQPCVDALRARGTPFVGCLYAGLMLTPDGVRVLEFNARFGDPEAQVLLPLLAEPALDLFAAAAHGELEPGRVAAEPQYAVGVVAAAAGYPGDVRGGDEISGLDQLDTDVLCFHAGTRLDPGGRLYTAGGRVLCVVAVGEGLNNARRCAYENIGRVHFPGMHFRRDIGAAPAASRIDALGVTA